MSRRLLVLLFVNGFRSLGFSSCQPFPATVANVSAETRVNPHFLTLGQAAKQSGLAKATISRAIRDGKLSATRSADTASYKIDPAELCRYAEAVKVLRATAETEGKKHSATPSVASETPSETALEHRLALVEERLRRELAEQRVADLRVALEEVKQERDQWREVAQRLSLAPPARASTVPPITPAARRWWPWRR